MTVDRFRLAFADKDGYSFQVMMMRSTSLQRLSGQRGSALVLVLLAVVVLGLGLGIAGSSWSTIVQRSKEQELFWRGDQIRKGIESFYTVKQGGTVGLYPNSLEELVEDPRSTSAMRHLRKVYLDPITGEDFVLIKEGGRIKGVKSSSTRTPFRQEGFPEEYAAFEGATSYDQWEFVYQPPKAKTNPNSTGTAPARSASAADAEGK